jgi:hypothetical protein
MFDASKLEGATDVAKAPPRVRREIHIFVDRAAKKLRVEPRGTLEKEAASEIIDTLGFPLTGGAANIVATAAAVAERWGWARTEVWTDEATDLHVKMAKEVGS